MRLAVSLLFAVALWPQPQPFSGAPDLEHSLRGLNELGSMMMIAAHPPQINTNWPPPLISPNATHGEGGGDIQREGKNE